MGFTGIIPGPLRTEINSFFYPNPYAIAVYKRKKKIY